MKKRVSQKPSTGTLWARHWAYAKILSAAVLAVLALAAGTPSASAADVFWDNGAGTGNWNTTDANWTGLIWNNSAPDNALFTTVGGDINLAAPIAAGSITFGSADANCTNASFNGGSLQADSLTVQGNRNNGPITTSVRRGPVGNTLTVNVPTVSIAGDVAVGRATLNITGGSFAADRIIAAQDSWDWADVIISGNATVTATNGIDGSTDPLGGGPHKETFALVLNGGTLYTPFINVADRRSQPYAGQAFMNWNGGKVVATGDSYDFITVYSGMSKNNVYVDNGGAILDTAGHEVWINVNLAALGLGGLTKLGAGTLTCTGINTYTGPTIVNEGTLVLTQPTLAAASPVIINATAVLSLNFAETNAVAGLTIGGVAKPPGTYNASNTPQISGSGSLLVLAGTSPRNLVWDNGAGTGNWNTTDANWTGNIWDNTRPDNALFATVGGTINLTEIMAGSVTLGSAGLNFPNASFTGGSLQAESLALGGSTGYGAEFRHNNIVSVLTVNGPTVSIAGDVDLGRATLAITSGSFAADRIFGVPITWDWAVLTISGNATVTLTNGVDFSAPYETTRAECWWPVLDLNGGTLYTPSIAMRVADWGGEGWFTWNGGKVVATASSADFITLTYAPSGEGTYTNSVWVGDGGAILDTAGNDVTVNCSLIAAGSGGLTKLGAGTLTLTGTNTYTGATTVNEGTLVISSPTLAAASTVIINANAVLKLDFAETITVAGLTIGGVAKPPGVYSASTTPQISGTGSLLVSPPVRPIITITRSDSNVVLTWEGGGVLQSATNVVGPYTDVTGSSSPWTITPTGVQGYYRVRQ